MQSSGLLDLINAFKPQKFNSKYQYDEARFEWQVQMYMQSWVPWRAYRKLYCSHVIDLSRIFFILNVMSMIPSARIQATTEELRDKRRLLQTLGTKSTEELVTLLLCTLDMLHRQDYSPFEEFYIKDYEYYIGDHNITNQVETCADLAFERIATLLKYMIEGVVTEE